jgi:hypothetical protein
MNDIKHISLSIITGSIFYFLTNYLPKKQKKEVLKQHLSLSYYNMKYNILKYIIWAANNGGNYSVFVGCTEDNLSAVEKLLDFKEFRKVFVENSVENSNEGWSSVLNGLTSRSDIIEDIINELAKFYKELDFVILLYPCDFKEYKEVRHLQNMITNLKHLNYNPNTDDLKSLSHFLFDVFAHFNHVGGLHENDIIQDLIERL